jgi:hypothetical protein
MVKPGLVVNCRLGNRQQNGYCVQMDGENDVAGFLLTESDLGAAEQVKGVVIAINTEQPLAILREYSRTDELCDSIFAKVASEVGLTIEDIKRAAVKINSISHNAAQHMKVDLTELGHDFDDNLVYVLSAWALVDAKEAEDIRNAHRAPNMVPVEDALITKGFLQDDQIRTIKLGRSLCEKGTIDFKKFAVAFRDELDGACTFRDSLAVRGWLALDADI